MTPNDEQVRSAVAQQAGEWFVANQAGGLRHEERAAFVAWFKASPMHVEEYLGIALIARDMQEAAKDPHPPLEELLAQASADSSDVVISLSSRMSQANREVPRPTLLTPWPFAAAAALIAISACVIWWRHDGELLGVPKTYRTVHGEQLVQQLPDGSDLYLDTDSQVTVRYSRNVRLVDLNRGQALFQVAPDSARQFRVDAGKTATIALGTRFNVYRKPDSTVVTVEEGLVAVVADSAASPAGSMGTLPDARQVGAGYQLRIDGGVMSAQATAVDLHQTLAWVQHKIAFERRPLGEVAEEFNRYGRIPLEIDDAGLRALPISGVFDIYDTDSFTTFLSRLDGVIVERTATRIRIMQTKSQMTEPITTKR